MRTLIATALLLSLATLAGCSCETRRFEHDGRMRSYVLHPPQGDHGDGALPLVIAMHGRGGTGAGTARSTQFDELADAHGFVVAFPDGVERSWADGREYSPADQDGVDDVGFIDALIDHVDEEITIDPSRVYAAGISNGASMAQRLACELTPRLAAVASMINNMPELIAEDCHPDSPISVLLMNGTEDPLVPYEGGEVSPANGFILSTNATISHWTTHNGCPGLTDSGTIDEQDDETSIEWELYQGCEGGSAVALYKVEGGGHTWPGGPQYLSVDLIGRVSEELEAEQVIWDFFEPLRR